MQKKRNILFITLGDQSGANTTIISMAEKLHKEGDNVQVLVRDKSVYNPLVTPLLPKDGFISELGSKVNSDGTLSKIARDDKYLFNTINEENSYQETEAILKQLRFSPNVIFVGITFDFLTSTDILKLSQACSSAVYNIAVDMNHFTGGCHFAWECEGYLKGCHNVDCPAVLEEADKDIPKKNFLIKQKNAEIGNFKVLAGTEWTKNQANTSLIYKGQLQTYNIPGIVDTEIFNPNLQKVSREVFGLNKDKFYILAGAENTQDKRKGYSHFVQAINLFWGKLGPEERSNIEVLSIARIVDNETFDKIKFGKKHVPYIKDNRLLSLIYQSADVFVNSSLEDSGPSMLLEALACGTPVVSFQTGAAPEMIINGKNGFLAKDKTPEGLAEALANMYRTPPLIRRKMGLDGSQLFESKGSLNVALKTIRDIYDDHVVVSREKKHSISVAMCTYNGAQFIEAQLDSILAQYVPVDEIVICDDGSTDATLAIVQSYSDKHPGIFKIHKNETLLRTVKNFEKAINLCTKETIFLSDQDDIWFPNKTKSIMAIFDKHPQIKGVSHNQNIFAENKQVSKITMWDSMGFSYYLKQNYKDRDFLFHTLFFGNMVSAAALCIRKPEKPISLLDGMKEVIHDYQLAIHYLMNDELYFHNECLGLYRQHSNQQIGPVVDRVELHRGAVRMYYEQNNPRWNLRYMKTRRKNEQVFLYIKAIENKKCLSIVRKNTWKNVVKLLFPF